MTIITPLLALALLTSPINQDHGAAPEPLQCTAGPIQRSFGGTEWLTYGCADRRTLIVVSAPGNPAMPFVFTLSTTDGGVRISGEGNGDQEATAPAFEDLKKISREVLDQMIREAETRP
ncbi:hypothetical protein [Brevundimonas sp. GCM10030266]|uniref:hypothetical protein n=1 Tax=Brevundimonas sp. GCM10030266 TaxID=3273386 RepID=UPI0036178AC1